MDRSGAGGSCVPWRHKVRGVVHLFCGGDAVGGARAEGEGGRVSFLGAQKVGALATRTQGAWSGSEPIGYADGGDDERVYVCV